MRKVPLPRTITTPGGRVIDPNAGIVGLDHEGRVHEGYDGVIYDPEIPELRHPADLTRDDLIHLAELMICRWKDFKRTIEEGPELPAPDDA